MRARRAHRTGTGHRRDPWQSPLHPGSPREARSALAFEMRWLISLPSPETCGISGRVAEARAELQAHRGPRAARRPSPAAPSARTWLPGCSPKGVDLVRASPHHAAPLSLGHQQELIDASVREAEARSSRCWDHEPATCRVWDPSVACDQHLTLWRTQRRTSHEPTEAPPAPWTGGAGERAPRAAHTRPSPPTALPPRPHVGTIFLPFSQAQLRVRVRVSLLLWRRAGPGGLRVHSASLRCAGARALRGRPRRPRSPLRLTPNP